jgi:opacity protein-like surface antigen
MVVRRPLGFFGGVGGGLAFGGNASRTQELTLGVDCIPGQPGDPANNLNRVGYAIAVPFGWQPLNSPLGLRFNVGYSSYHRAENWLANDGSTGAYETHPQVWTADADARLKLGTIFTRRLSPYVVGGLSYGRFRRTIDVTGSDPIDNQDQSWHNSWGYNAGGGLEYLLGRTGVFVEAKYYHLNGASGINALNHVPVVVGLTWY